jgi:hypothetical protein
MLMWEKIMTGPQKVNVLKMKNQLVSVLKKKNKFHKFKFSIITAN